MIDQRLMDPQLVQPDLILNDNIFCNDHEALRLYKIRDYFGYHKETVGSYINKQGEQKEVVAYSQIKPLKQPVLDQLVDLYTSWRDLDEVVPVKYVYQNKTTREFITEEDATTYALFMYNHFNVSLFHHMNVVTIPFEVYDWRFPHACKRGNPVYIDIVKERFKPFLEQDPITFFDPAYVGVRKRKSKTSMLYITGTTDPKTCGFDRGWLSFGKHWNSFITNLRKQFGEKVILFCEDWISDKNPEGTKFSILDPIVYIRAWQSQENGYPHFHALLYFKDIKFTVVRWQHDNGKVSFRLPSRAKYRSAIKKAWKWGHLDIICVDNTQDAFKDLLKYVTRDLEGGESDLTNTMVWYFGKQAFGISRDFAEVVWGTNVGIGLAEPTNADLINDSMCNSNLDLIRIEIYPTIRSDLLYSDPPKTYQTTFYGKDPPPKPPPNMIFLESITVEYDLVKCKPSKKFVCPVFMYVRRG